MKKICSYCRAHYGETGQPPPPGTPPGAVTHGICPACLTARFPEVAAELKRENARKLRAIAAMLLAGYFGV